MSNSDCLKDKGNYKYHVVEVLDAPYNEFEKFVCVPLPWIFMRDSTDKSIAFKYPIEDTSVTMQRVKRKEAFSNDWQIFSGHIKYASDSYKDINRQIEVLKTRGDAEAEDNDVNRSELCKQLTLGKNLKIRFEEQEWKRLKLSQTYATGTSLECQASVSTETVATISETADTQETRNTAVKINPKKYKYCVVEFSNVTKQIGKFICIPSSWIKYFDKRNQTVVFNYRADNLEEMEEFVRKNNPPLQVGRTLVALLKYSTDSYEDAKVQIETLNGNNSSTSSERAAKPNLNITPTDYSQMSTPYNNMDSAVENTLQEIVHTKSKKEDKTVFTDKESSLEDIKEIIKDNPIAFMTEFLNREKDLDKLYGPNFLESLENKYCNLEHFYLMAKKLSQGYYKRCSTLKNIIDSIKNYNKINNEHIDLTPDDIANRQSQSTKVDQKIIKIETDYVKHKNTEKEVIATKNGRDFIDLTKEDTATAETQDMNIVETIKVETDLNSKRQIEATKQNNNDVNSIIILDDDDDNVNDEGQMHPMHAEAKQNTDTIPAVIAGNYENQSEKILKDRQRHSSKLTLSPHYKTQDSKWTLRHKNKTDNLTELIEGSGIYVNAHKLTKSLSESATRKSLAAKLVPLIFSDNALTKCSLTGYKTKRPALDEYARNIMFEFIEIYGNHKNWPGVSRNEIKNGISNKLYTERRKKKSC